MSMNKPLVSVIIPTYKRADMLTKAIDSAINQTYKNIEIIVIDDNDPSSKYRFETKKKLSSYIQSGVIRYIENEKNLGGAITRNRAVEQSKGEYIAFLDDDDIFFPTKIEKQVEVMIQNKDNNVGLVYCHCNGVDEEGNILWENTNSYEGLPLYESMIYCIASTSLWLCDKKMLLDIGGFEDTPSKQDLLLMVKIISNEYKIICVREKLVNYLNHNKGKISTIEAKDHIADGYEKLRDYCKVNYNKLTKKEMIDVEYRLSRTLCIQYKGLNQRNKSYKELFNMIKQKPYNLGNIKMILRILGFIK